MSNQDSFIDEVSEEVRRDQLYGYLRRYGWIGALVILAIVGGAAWIEWSKARTEETARQGGAALDAALQIEDHADRAAALEAVEIGDATVLARFALVLSHQQVGETEEAIAVLEELMARGDVYGDIATLRRAGLEGAVPSPQERIDMMQSIVAADGPFALMAREQIGFALVEQGEIEAAQEEFSSLIDAPGATDALRTRAIEMIIATGGEVDSGPVLVESTGEGN